MNFIRSKSLNLHKTPFALSLSKGCSSFGTSRRKSSPSTSSGRTGKKRPMGTHLLIALAIAFAPPAIAQSDGQSPQPAIAADNYPYQLFLPRGYHADPQANWPLLVFLHGSGERGAEAARAKVNDRTS